MDNTENKVENKTESKGSMTKIIGAVVVVAVLIGGGYLYFTKNKTGQEQVAVVKETVAKVNGIEITKEAYDAQLASSIASLKAQGVADADSTEKLPALRTQVLSDMVSNELVNQGIKAAGIVATQAEVDAQYQALVTQLGGADKLKAEMDKAGLTDAKLRENITRQVAVQKYLLANINVASIAVTDAEIKKFYDDNSKGQTGVPPLKDLSAQIKNQLTQQKQQILISAFIDTLKAKAQIETTLK